MEKKYLTPAITVIIVVVVGLFFINTPSPFSGAATGLSGAANFTIVSALSINFVTNQDVVTFGAGRVESTCNNATLATNDTSQDPDGCWTGTFAYNTTTNVFEIENDGSINATVSVNGTDAATFLGGTTVTPEFQFYGVNNEANSCAVNITTTWTDINATQQLLCSTFQPGGLNDQMYTHIRVVIPDDASIGTHNATVEFTAS